LRYLLLTFASLVGLLVCAVAAWSVMWLIGSVAEW
jgi:hypothetical protein